MKLAVIVDDWKVQRFALEALDAITSVDEITVYSCGNTQHRKRWLRHAAYYALNLLTVRNRLTRYVSVTHTRKKIARSKEFASGFDEAWQVLPEEIAEELNGFDVVLKFGMGLLRVPASLSTPILSYHHGDPDHYRGRPAGFWEMVEKAPAVGQVIQVIGNKLDAGQVVAFAETKLFPWSYRATLIEAYRASPLIIDTAILNALAGTYLPKASKGRNYRLPSNGAVVAFVVRMAIRFARRLLYGAFREKAWQVSSARNSGGMPKGTMPPVGEWKTFPTGPDYQFYADPFFSNDGILVEALSRRTGLGQIVRLEGEGGRLLIAEPGHLSYPATVTIDGREVMIPETASWSFPRVYSLNAMGADFTSQLIIKDRVSDPTLFEWNGRLYLFGNRRETGSNVLHLWSADKLDREFTLHPESPVRISPVGSRMGGSIIEQNGRLYRLGQDLSGDYGNGLILFEINDLSLDSYSESLVGKVRFADRKGPHTLNIRRQEMVFDWYHDRFTIFAGFRRMAAALQRRRRPSATQ